MQWSKCTVEILNRWASTMADSSEYLANRRAYWDDQASAYAIAGAPAWAEEPRWGILHVPETTLPCRTATRKPRPIVCAAAARHASLRVEAPRCDDHDDRGSRRPGRLDPQPATKQLRDRRPDRGPPRSGCRQRAPMAERAMGECLAVRVSLEGAKARGMPNTRSRD
jgi:hypothetical protein